MRCFCTYDIDLGASERDYFGLEESLRELGERIGSQVLKAESGPNDSYVNLTITDDEGIQAVNKAYRDIDASTDVLSFPNLDFEEPGVFHISRERRADYVDPENGLIYLGDIMISTQHVLDQAAAYGHSKRREIAFLIAHSMYHLCGYDHMTQECAAIMEEKQEAVLSSLGISREEDI